jgi:hypothetical protein
LVGVRTARTTWTGDRSRIWRRHGRAAPSFRAPLRRADWLPPHQGGGPIAFFSRQITARHAKLAAYEHELIGLVQAVKTDHYSLKSLLDQRLSTILQHRWVSKLIGFDFRVEYKPGSSNTVADALSRRDTGGDVQLVAVSAPFFTVFDDLRVETEEVESLRQLKEEVTAGRKGEAWKIVDGLITVGGKAYVAADSPCPPTILAAAHGMGHEGTEKRSIACAVISSSREHGRLSRIMFKPV